jgi:DNA end-binding protein Ku
MRTLWKGAISFGLINIPVGLYVASRARELNFKLLHKKDQSEIQYIRVCKADGKEVPWDDIVKGYAYAKDKYVIMTEEDFEKANPKKTKTIEIVNFTLEEEIDTMLFQTPYYIEPQKGAVKAYQLLKEALKRSKKVAVVKFVLRQHEHLGIIKPHGDLLVLEELRYTSELVSPNDLNIPKESALSKQELDMAMKLIQQQTKTFKPKDYSDTYTDEIKAIIKRKAKGKKISMPEEKNPKSPKVHDIMDLLKKSLKKPAKKKKIA